MINLSEVDVQLNIESVDPLPLNPLSVDLECYPQLRLRPSGQLAPRTFAGLSLDNDRLQAVIVPELGGRIMSLVRKGHGEALPQRSDLTVEPVGPRGAWLPDGIQICVGAREGRDSLGTVDVQVRPPEGDEDPAAILIHSYLPGLDVSWSACISLGPLDSFLTLEVRVFNRSLLTPSCPVGVWLPGSFGVGLIQTGSGSGVRISGESGIQGWVGDGFGISGWAVEPESSTLFPRESLSFRLQMEPLAGLDSLASAGEFGAQFGQTEDHLLLLAGEDSPRARLQISTPEGVMEALVDLAADTPLALSKSQFGGEVSEVKIVHQGDRAESWTLADGPAWPAALPSALRNSLSLDGTAEELALLAMRNGQVAPASPSTALNAPIAVSEALRVLREDGDKPHAMRLLEIAILTNSEDHLAWWLKGWLHRSTAAEGEIEEILNAHFLAPMDPMLRADAFLAQGTALGREPSPLCRPLAKNPDAGLDAIHQLLEAGLVEEAGRLLDELLRHDEIVMARILLAWLLHTRSRMAAETGTHLAKVEAAPLRGPFPWRKWEIEACLTLAEAFPAFKNLGMLAQMAESAAGLR